MKKACLLSLILVALYGCGPSLHELMADKPTTIKIIEKDTFCVYNKLNMLILSDITRSQWHSAWDSSTKKGEIIRCDIPILCLTAFNIQRTSNKTLVELRVASQYGISSPMLYSANKSLASDILSSADFSGCPDIP